MNVMKTCETPSVEVERNSSMPLMVLTAASTLSVISVSISCGEAPGLVTVTVIVGRSILGNRSTPRPRNEKSPTTVIAIINIAANTGRRTHISASFCIIPLTLLPHDLCAIVKLIEITDGNRFPGIHSRYDSHRIALFLARLHYSQPRRVAFDHVS